MSSQVLGKLHPSGLRKEPREVVSLSPFPGSNELDHSLDFAGKPALRIWEIRGETPEHDDRDRHHRQEGCDASVDRRVKCHRHPRREVPVVGVGEIWRQGLRRAQSPIDQRG